MSEFDRKVIHFLILGVLFWFLWQFSVDIALLSAAAFYFYQKGKA